jgi:hypothetical protein
VRRVNIEILALGTAVLLALLGALWKACGLRGDLFEKWNPRISLAEAGLSNKAAQALVELHEQVNQLLFPAPGVRFDPLKLVADPDSLRASVNQFLYLLDVRSRLARQFNLLLRVGPLLRLGLLMSVLAAVAFFSQSSHVIKMSPLYPVAIVLGCPGAVIICLAFGLYMYLQQKLSGAEILSSLASPSV